MNALRYQVTHQQEKEERWDERIGNDVSKQMAYAEGIRGEGEFMLVTRKEAARKDGKSLLKEVGWKNVNYMTYSRDGRKNARNRQ